jgi:hypothetical protein
LGKRIPQVYAAQRKEVIKNALGLHKLALNSTSCILDKTPRSALVLACHARRHSNLKLTKREQFKMSTRNVVLSFAAGLLGGAISHYALSPQLVHAQSQAIKEFRAESFILVNEKGAVLGTLSHDRGKPSLKLFDERGREIWSAGGRSSVSTAVLGR